VAIAQWREHYARLKFSWASLGGAIVKKKFLLKNFIKKKKKKKDRKG